MYYAEAETSKQGEEERKKQGGGTQTLVLEESLDGIICQLLFLLPLLFALGHVIDLNAVHRFGKFSFDFVFFFAMMFLVVSLVAQLLVGVGSVVVAAAVLIHLFHCSPKKKIIEREKEKEKLNSPIFVLFFLYSRTVFVA